MSRPVTYLSMTSVGLSSVASTDDDILIPIFADQESLPRDASLSFYFSASSICPSVRDNDICLSPVGTFCGASKSPSHCSTSDYNDNAGIQEEIGVQRQQLQDVGEEDENEVEVDDDVDAETIPDSSQATGLRHTAALESTAAYHESLLDQHRHLTTPEPQAPRSTSSRATSHNGNGFLLSALYWIQLPKAKIVSKASESRGASPCSANTSSAARPPRVYHDSQCTNVSREDLEEFVSLPGAIQRKFFSTSERLRFESSGHLQQNKENPDFDLDFDLVRNNSFSTTLSQPRGDLSTPAHWRQPVTQPPATPLIEEQEDPDPECFVLAKQLPPTYTEKHLTREEQVLLAKALRESVILDTARDLQAKLQLVGPGTDPETSPDFPSGGHDTEAASSIRSSMESAIRITDGGNRPAKLEDPQNPLVDSFRWLEEDEDLDLRLVLDNYPQAHKGQQPLPKKDNSASFRRHLSLTRMSFNRSSSLYTTQPVAQDAISPTTTSPTLSQSARENKRKSRALSLITPKHAPRGSVTSIDPDAAHYQDPETRSKLRDFLASPQKFDEAIEYGFPSQEDTPMDPSKDTRQHLKGHTRQNPSEDSERFKTFFADDQSSTYSEDISMADSESPRTPHTPDQSPSKSSPISSHSDDRTHKAPNHFSQGHPASREMTLRMTLTRPDLRACETDIYGWQRGSSRQSGRVSQASHVRYDSPPPPTHKYASKDSFDKVFAEIDQEVNETQQDRGVMKRMWKRVRKA